MKLFQFCIAIVLSNNENSFEPFKQLASNEPKHGGTGLGLTITRQLVRALGGTISVESEFGHWFEFKVTLPCSACIVAPSVVGSDTRVRREDTNKSNVSLSKFFGGSSISQHTRTSKHGDTNKTFSEGSFSARMYDDSSIDDESCFSDDESSFSNSLMSSVSFQHIVEAANARKQESKSAGNATWPGNSKGGSKNNKKKNSLMSHLMTPLQGKNTGSLRSLRLESSGRSSISSGNSESLASAPSSFAPPTFVQSQRSLTPPPQRALTPPPSPVEKPVVDQKVFEHFHILIAEDNVINQKVLHRTLTRIGVKDIDIVDNGQKAVEISEGKTYDIIFMDMQMPIMDGLEATSIISKREKRPRIVFLTAHALKEFQAQAKEAGGDDFISKPFKIEVIRGIMIGMLEED